MITDRHDDTPDVALTPNTEYSAPADRFDVAQMRQSILDRITEVVRELEATEHVEKEAAKKRRNLRAELDQLQRTYKVTDPNYRKRQK